MTIYVKIMSNKSSSRMVPFQAWTGLKPNVQSLKIFGCLAFVHVVRIHDEVVH